MPGDLAVASAVFDRLGADFDRFGAVFDRFGVVSIENGAETKHLNSTGTARHPKGPGSSSRIQMLKSRSEKSGLAMNGVRRLLNAVRCSALCSGVRWN